MYFAWKQLKVDYSKYIWKEENWGHGFVCLLDGYISVKEIIEKCDSVVAGAHKVGEVFSFWASSNPNFTEIYKAMLEDSTWSLIHKLNTSKILCYLNYLRKKSV